MMLWLERKEKILRHDQYIQWRLKGYPGPPVVENLHPGIVYERKPVMPKHPTHKSHSAVTLLNFLIRAQVEAAANNIDLLFNAVPVFQRIKFSTSDPHASPNGPEDKIIDSIHVQPAHKLPNGDEIPARFDTALVNTGDGGMTGVGGYRIAQVRLVFTLPPRIVKELFPAGVEPPKYLAYVEWFSRFTKEPERNHLMFKISRSEIDGERMASIIPVQNIRRSIHLLPKFGPVAPPEWKSSNVLKKCRVFFANPWTDRHTLVEHFE
ncbi:hypothetical protein C8R47DRAFT_1237438 [Mycena vitilis]|nr:hypothetical protein C8R47DRAFT_1237438 [Mycena vitilis]